MQHFWQQLGRSGGIDVGFCLRRIWKQTIKILIDLKIVHLGICWTNRMPPVSHM